MLLERVSRDGTYRQHFTSFAISFRMQEDVKRRARNRQAYL